MRNWRTRGLASVLGCAVLTAVACGDEVDEPLFVTMQDRELIGGEWMPSGSGCLGIAFGDEAGASFGSASAIGGVAGGAAVFDDGGVPIIPESFSIERSMVPQGLRVAVIVEGQALAIKIYTKPFFESGKTDRFEVTTPRGARHQLAHRGAHECETNVDLFAE
jgi:hypothetical protein